MAEGNYVFPRKLANFMSKISLRTQYEASMMSILFIMLGILGMAVYVLFFTEFSVLFKVYAAINALAGLGFLGSFLVTTFQQYKSYLFAVGVIQNE